MRWIPSRLSHLFALIVLIDFNVGMAAAGDDAAKELAKRFAGTWKCDRMEFDGKECDNEDGIVRDLKIVGTTLQFGIASLVAGSEERGRFTVVGVKDGIGQVDVSVEVKSGGDMGGQHTERVSSLEIWRLLDKDTLQRCLWGGKNSERGRERPKKFVTAPGDRWMIFTF